MGGAQINTCPRPNQRARSIYRQQRQSRSHNGWQLKATIDRMTLYLPVWIGVVKDIDSTAALFIAWCENLAQQPESIK
jgi:hypothetical protein